MKKCSKCGIKKSRDEFIKRQSAKDGLDSYCKSCKRKIEQDSYRLDPNKMREKSRNWYHAHVDKARRKSQRYRNENLDRVHEKDRRWQKSNPDKRRANWHRWRTAVVDNGGSFTSHEWEDLCAKYDYRCLACGKKKPLEADHIIPVSMGGNSNISNIQPLCKSCNSRKNAKHIDYRLDWTK